MYIIKIPYSSNDPFDCGLHYLYVTRFELSHIFGFSYCAALNRDLALVLTEPIAEWLCTRINDIGEDVVIMEQV